MSADSGSSYLTLLAVYLVAVGILFQTMGDRNIPFLAFLGSLFLVGLSVWVRLSEESASNSRESLE